ncbi:site-specific DNA-methyltransferase [Candidatus Poribacteria bacterium]|nr:site-specific DNA-methyltransferase [Candidatus Poribacteria bacterium]MYK97049.1 site-specific DNA-methyltransferase [Candidatus Poribacteria bacterium]
MSPNEILEWFDQTPIDKMWSFDGCKPSDTGKWTHGYHRYPAKFIPQLVERLMDTYITNGSASVNDPFMGCGTTVVSAISRGFHASGTDINKVAHLVAGTKAIAIRPDYLEEKVKQFLSKIWHPEDGHTFFPCNQVEPYIPEKHLERIDYWFTEAARNELGKILTLIRSETDLDVQSFLLVSFSHILKTCSIWSQASTKPTRDLKKRPTLPYDAIKRHLLKMLKGNAAFYGVVPLQVKDNPDNYLNIQIGSAKAQPVPNSSVDLIVSSSPYVTSYEYADLHQLSTLWLDLADDLKAYKKEFIGTSYKRYEGKPLLSQIASNIVDKMVPKSRSKAKEIEAFFIDMQEVFNESFRILKPGGRCCYVIGNTKLKGVDILNAEAFAESLQYSGFKLDRLIKREIPLKILPQKRDEKTGRFASKDKADSEAYPTEYIVIGLKE